MHVCAATGSETRCHRNRRTLLHEQRVSDDVASLAYQLEHTQHPRKDALAMFEIRPTLLDRPRGRGYPGVVRGYASRAKRGLHDSPSRDGVDLLRQSLTFLDDNGEHTYLALPAVQPALLRVSVTPTGLRRGSTSQGQLCSSRVRRRQQGVSARWIASASIRSSRPPSVTYSPSHVPFYSTIAIRCPQSYCSRAISALHARPAPPRRSTPLAGAAR